MNHEAHEEHKAIEPASYVLQKTEKSQMGLLEKANKRNCYPVVLADRTVYVRSMKTSEIRRMNALDQDLRTAFVLGICLTLENSAQEIPKLDAETDADYSKRVDAALSDAEVDTETISTISQAIGKIGKVNLEDLEKN